MTDTDRAYEALGKTRSELARYKEAHDKQQRRIRELEKALSKCQTNPNWYAMQRGDTSALSRRLMKIHALSVAILKGVNDMTNALTPEAYLAGQMAEALAERNARIAELEAALKPLAHVADQFDGMYETHDSTETTIGTDEHPVTVGNFRRIRDLLNKKG